MVCFWLCCGLCVVVVVVVCWGVCNKLHLEVHEPLEKPGVDLVGALQDRDT